jgi:hypothetical protein
MMLSWQSHAMRKLIALSVLCLWPVLALAGENSSVYTKFDLDHCKKTDNGDEYVYAGTWTCKGYGGIDMVFSSIDERSYAAFGKDGINHCAFQKTFSPFNTALSPVEWRLKDGKPIAAIERWSVVEGDSGKSVTWLVVNALREHDSCHVHYVSGSYPDANADARRAADDLAADFDCDNDVPTVDSKVGLPPIEFIACKDIARE